VYRSLQNVAVQGERSIGGSAPMSGRTAKSDSAYNISVAASEQSSNVDADVARMAAMAVSARAQAGGSTPSSQADDSLLSTMGPPADSFLTTGLPETQRLQVVQELSKEGREKAMSEAGISVDSSEAEKDVAQVMAWKLAQGFTDEFAEGTADISANSDAIESDLAQQLTSGLYAADSITASEVGSQTGADAQLLRLRR
jgi:hypothetical protein